MATSFRKLTQALSKAQYVTKSVGVAAIAVDAGAKALKYSGIPQLTKALPYGAVVYGGLGVASAIFEILERHSQEKKLKGIVDGILSYQIYANGMDALYSAGSLLAVYNSLALKSAATCVYHLYEIYHGGDLYKHEYEEKLNEAIVSAIETVGWYQLSVGNPLGAALLVLALLIANCNFKLDFSNPFSGNPKAPSGGRPGGKAIAQEAEEWAAEGACPSLGVAVERSSAAAPIGSMRYDDYGAQGAASSYWSGTSYAFDDATSGLGASTVATSSARGARSATASNTARYSYASATPSAASSRSDAYATPRPPAYGEKEGAYTAGGASSAAAARSTKAGMR